MTIKEAILLSLEDFPYGAIMREVYDNILKKNIFKFSKKKHRHQMQRSVLCWET